jgi:hypothetical protein
LFSKLKNWRRIATRYDKPRNHTSASLPLHQPHFGYPLSTTPGRTPETTRPSRARFWNFAGVALRRLLCGISKVQDAGHPPRGQCPGWTRRFQHGRSGAAGLAGQQPKVTRPRAPPLPPRPESPTPAILPRAT